MQDVLDGAKLVITPLEWRPPEQVPAVNRWEANNR